MIFDDGAKLPFQSAEYDQDGVFQFIESTNPTLLNAFCASTTRSMIDPAILGKSSVIGML